MAQGAGATGYIASPSFVLIREYAGPVPVFHVDLYRLERREEIADLGLQDLITESTIVFVEWADRAPEILPADHLRIDCAFGVKATDRRFTITIPKSWDGRFDQALRGAVRG